MIQYYIQITPNIKITVGQELYIFCEPKNSYGRAHAYGDGHTTWVV